MLEGARRWARSLRRDIHALHLAARDPRTPPYVKALAICIVAYALSPIDLIPDFIPVLGYLDDLILLPVALWIALRLIPPEALAEHRAAAEGAPRRPASRLGAAIVVSLWLASAGLLLAWLWP
jgi:uncharacterized membrane protein YkvA (DUF1232 family)